MSAFALEKLPRSAIVIMPGSAPIVQGEKNQEAHDPKNQIMGLLVERRAERAAIGPEQERQLF